jgi:hypothetical protein
MTEKSDCSRRVGWIEFPTEFYEDGLMDGCLVTPPAQKDPSTDVLFALATDPTMRRIEDGDEPPWYQVRWQRGERIFLEEPYGGE